MVYYNEIDPYAAQWLRNLIAAGHIANGEVDERSIQLVDPADLAGFTQCHFFAGIGVWSHALRLAGWPDDRPVWTGSCPCQPFSAAGKGAGFADERHLWPNLHRLISKCRPPVVFGEQVASKDGLEWLDLVQADLQRTGYASAAVDLCAAGVGAPHIRQRLYWVADTDYQRRGEARGASGTVWTAGGGATDRMADSQHDGYHRQEWIASQSHSDQQVKRISDGDCAVGGLDNNNNKGLEGQRDGHQTAIRRVGEVRSVAETSELGGLGDAKSSGDRKVAAVCQGQNTQSAGDRDWPSPTHGFWRDADWLFCRDGKWRPVEPGTFPLAHGAASRVGRLRAYGNAIVPQVAQTFIEAFMDCRP